MMTATGRPRTHVIQRGESFATIAAAVYGNSAYYPHLLRANPKLDPKKLRPGMTINIPDPSQVVAAANTSARETATANTIDSAAAALPLESGSAAPAGSSSTIAAAAPTGSGAATAIDDATQYRVRPNDSLYKISLRLYGKADRVDKLYELNKDVIGANPAHVKAGMVLKLPEPPSATASAR